MIYKTWFGKHIDLSKIVSISDAEIIKHDYDMIGFTIHCQLLDQPIIHCHDSDIWKSFTNVKIVEQELNGNYKVRNVLGFHGIDGKDYADYQLSENLDKFKPTHELQQKIDELVKVWKAFKESQQSCETCANYSKKKIDPIICPECQSSDIWIRDKPKPFSWRCGNCDNIWTP